MATGKTRSAAAQQPQSAREILQRPLLRVNREVVAYLALVIVSIITHLWKLDAMAMHHDESIHAWASWNFYMGRGGTDCAWGGKSPTYCYNPIYHGPSLYIFTLISYFLFGDGDAQARLPMALAGVAMVASAWMFRPLIGRRAAFIAGLLFAFSPSLLYFTRFARHDGLMVLWEVWMVAAVFRYLQSGEAKWLYLLAVSLALAVATHELYYILFFIFGMFVLVRLIAESRYAHYLNGGLLGAMVLCVILIILNPPLPFGKGLYLGEKAFLVGISLLMAWLAQHIWPRQPLLTRRMVELIREKRSTLAVAIGLLLSIYVVMYTTFLTNPRGITGVIDGIVYWLGSQHAYRRGDQPWYYYLMQLPVYEPLTVVCGIGAWVALLLRKRPTSTPASDFAPLPDPASASNPGTATHQPLEPTPVAASHPAHASMVKGGETTLALDPPPVSNPGAATHHTSEPNLVAAWHPTPMSMIEGKETTLPTDASDAPSPRSTGSETTKLGQAQTTPHRPAGGNQEPGKLGWLWHKWSRWRKLLSEGQGRWFALPERQMELHPTVVVTELVPLFLLFWFVNAIVVFSWAGEKMPWLLVHMTLPGCLLAAWVLGKLLAVLDEPFPNPPAGQEQLPALRSIWLWFVPPALILMFIAFGVAVWRFSTPVAGQQGQSHVLQGIIPLLVGGAMLYSLLTLLVKLGWQHVLTMAALTLAVGLGGYTLRSTWLAVYAHPDTPIELLVYTQTSPNIPYLVREIEEMAINLGRNYRSPKDVTGSFSLPMVIDSGNQQGEGSLAWPLQWYFRHFLNITWLKSDELQNPTPATFEVHFPDGQRGLAPLVMLFRPHVTSQVREVLERHYSQPYGEKGSLNWWFPEGNKCAPESPGYKRFYFSTWTPVETLKQPSPQGCGRDISASLSPPWAPILWPFLPANWNTLRDFLLFRKLPPGLSIGAREIEVWVRTDIAGTVSTPAMRGASLLPLEARTSFGQATELWNPTGIAIGPDGRIYVSDTMNHRIQVYTPDGKLAQTIGGGGPGNAIGMFNEPRGIAVDAQGNIYVADTWNARVVKLDTAGTWLKTWGSGNQEMGAGRMVTVTGGSQEANANTPMGFFGPRALALDAKGNVYLADTGNKRIVVTDGEGNYLYQWGYAGAGPGQFNEPTGIALDSSGNVYVADSWNGRVQVFPVDANGRVAPAPVVMWNVAGWEPNTYEDPNIAVDAEGELVFVSVPRRNSVIAANMRGDILFRWGGAGNDLASLNAPSGIAVGNDRQVFVVDRTANRVLEFVIPQVRARTK